MSYPDPTAPADASPADPPVEPAATAPEVSVDQVLATPDVASAIDAAVQAGIAAHIAASTPKETPDLKVGDVVHYVYEDVYAPNGPTQMKRPGIVLELSDPDPSGDVTAVIAWLDLSGTITTRDLELR